MHPNIMPVQLGVSFSFTVLLAQTINSTTPGGLLENLLERKVHPKAGHAFQYSILIPHNPCTALKK